MREAAYILMCFVHRSAKRLLRRYREPVRLRFVDIAPQDISNDGTVSFSGLSNAPSEAGSDGRVSIDELYPLENAVLPGSNLHLQTSFHRARSRSMGPAVCQFSPALWRAFIDNADIPTGYKNSGLKYAGFIASGRNSWCLPSWIWTNGAIVRYLCSAGEIDQAIQIGDRLLSRQVPAGGWIVRSDYTVTDEIPVVAPNDSAYIANNACLELFEKTGDAKYLHAARKCADWIISCARPDGLVWTGYDNRTGTWLKEHMIVDTGFTAGLFARLFMLTGEARYGEFLKRFAERFIELFYDPETCCFATSLDGNDRRVGGRFARGQAWALEGLIPAYQALGTESLRHIVAANVRTIIQKQLSNGGWAYNFDKTYLGEDCKGVPILAKALLNWCQVMEDETAYRAAKAALNWCVCRTSLSGPSTGGIFSFSSEGAVVHNFYTKTAFVYSSAYALECWKALSTDA